MLDSADGETARSLIDGLIAIRLYAPLPEMVEPLAALLARTEDLETRRQAVRALGVSQEPEAVPVLESLLETLEPYFLEEVIRAIGRINDRSARPALRNLMASPEVRTRMAAVEVLRRWDDPGDRDLLDGALEDASWSVGAAAYRSRPRPRGWSNAPERPTGRYPEDLSPQHRVHPDTFQLETLREHLSARLEPDPDVRCWVRSVVLLLEAELPYGDPTRSFRSAEYIGRLVPLTPGLSRVGLQPAPLACPHCGGRGHEVLHVPGDRIGRPGRDVRLIRCQECIFFGPHYVFWRGGQAVRIAFESADLEDFHKGKVQGPQASLIWEPAGRAFPGREGREDQTHAGSLPLWLQSDEWPECPLCREDMAFVLQLDSDTLDTINHRSELSGQFNLFLENYATFFLFECPGCGVTASVSQCS